MKFRISTLLLPSFLAALSCSSGDGRHSGPGLIPTASAASKQRAQLFFQQEMSTPSSAAPIGTPSVTAQMAITLLQRYVPIDSQTSTDDVAYYIAVAIKKMYLQAMIHETDGTPQFILNRMLQHPETPYWANCGSSADLMVILLSFFGIDAHIVSLWHTLGDGHVAIEYFSTQLNKYVYYDPLYGVYMVDESGQPASVSEIIQEIEKNGFDSQIWQYQPVRLYDLNSDNYVPATSPQYDYYNRLDYSIVLNNYFNVIAVRYQDYTPFQYLKLRPPGEQTPLGTWKIYSFIPSPTEWAKDKNELLAHYDVSSGGKYILNFEDTSVVANQVTNVNETP